MTYSAIELELRNILSELQHAGDISPQLDVANLPLNSTMAGAGLDSVARVGLAALIDERLGVWLEDDQVDDDTSMADIIEKIASERTT